MTSILLQLICFLAGAAFISSAAYYGTRPFARAWARGKMNELPRLDASIAADVERAAEPRPVRCAIPEVAVIPQAPVSAIPKRTQPAVNPALLMKTEKVYFIR